MAGTSIKSKMIMLIFMVLFMIMYSTVFGDKNAVIGIMIVIAALMNLGNDLSYKPQISFVKVLFLLLFLGIVSFINNPINLFGCALTFVAVFITTFTSYHLFDNDVYLPYLMCYFMMMCTPISFNQLPMRLLALALGAVFIVGLNILINRNKTYKISSQTLNQLSEDLKNVIDSKLNDETVLINHFKIADEFYSSLYSKFEYKFFPTPAQDSFLNLIKAFQYIGDVILEFDLSKNELLYIKEVLTKIDGISKEQLYSDVDIETKEMYLVLLNFEIIIHEMKKDDLENESLTIDKKQVRQLLKPLIKKQFSFRSVKFTFAFKMALVLTLWEILTLIFNLPYTKWLYFSTIPLMLPYVDDMYNTARERVKGTFVGVLIFALIFVAMPYVPISSHLLIMAVFFISLFGMVSTIENKYQMSIFSTIISVMVSLMYISPAMAFPLKIIWIIVAVIVVSIVNYGFLPYSVEKETMNNLKIRSKLNNQSVDLIKQKALNNDSKNKSAILVLSNVVRENIEVTDENEEVYILQDKITNISNFILTYMDVNEVSDNVKKEIIKIIDENETFDENHNINELIMLHSTKYVVELLSKEKMEFI